MKPLLTRRMQDTLAISYWGYFTSLGGYGISNINWVKHLSRNGVKVYPHAKFLPQKGSLEYSILTEEEKELLYIPYESQKIGIIESTPFDFHLIENPIKIASTMAETDRMGEPWVNACSAMDYIVVPNEFQKTVFINSGVPESKIRVIRFGTETEKFPYFRRPVRDIFTFGTVGYLNDRKGVFELVRAFASEFKPWEPVRLYLKSSNKDFGFYTFEDKRIIVDIRHLSPEELNRVYQGFDCFVFPSKAEGVGQPPREAMATGLPVIVTNYSGLEEICNPDYCYPIEPSRFVEGINPQNIEQPGNWAEVDVQELMYLMRYVYEHPEDASELGARASSWIRREHSWNRASLDMISFLKGI